MNSNPEQPELTEEQQKLIAQAKHLIGKDIPCDGYYYVKTEEAELAFGFDSDCIHFRSVAAGIKTMNDERIAIERENEYKYDKHTTIIKKNITEIICKHIVNSIVPESETDRPAVIIHTTKQGHLFHFNTFEQAMKFKKHLLAEILRPYYQQGTRLMFVPTPEMSSGHNENTGSDEKK